MSLLYAAGGFAVGFILGIGAALFYLRWKMSQQLGMMQDQMEDMMDMTGDMDDAFGMAGEMEDIEVEAEVEEQKRDEEGN